jgi:hypothetical protein
VRRLMIALAGALGLGELMYPRSVNTHSITGGRNQMFKTLTIVATAALALATAFGTAAHAGASTDPAVVDFGNCAFGNGVATVPAAEPITLTDTGGFAVGTYGLALHIYKSNVATATIAVTDGATTTTQLAYSAPQFVGAPFFAWLSFLQDLSLDPLASGGSVLVTIDQTPTVAGEVVFPGQKGPAPHFGPFHISAGDTSEAQCLIIATS